MSRSFRIGASGVRVTGVFEVKFFSASRTCSGCRRYIIIRLLSMISDSVFAESRDSKRLETSYLKFKGYSTLNRLTDERLSAVPLTTALSSAATES